MFCEDKLHYKEWNTEKGKLLLNDDLKSHDSRKYWLWLLRKEEITVHKKNKDGVLRGATSDQGKKQRTHAARGRSPVGVKGKALHDNMNFSYLSSFTFPLYGE